MCKLCNRGQKYKIIGKLANFQNLKISKLANLEMNIAGKTRKKRAKIGK